MFMQFKLFNDYQQIISTLKQADVDNFVTITGDLHLFTAGYLYENFNSLNNAPEPTSDPPSVPGVEYPAGVCFMAGSMTSSNLSEIATNGVGFPAPVMADPQVYKAANPHIVHFDSSTHGYNILDITSTQLTCRMQPVNPIKMQEGAAKGNRPYSVCSGTSI